MISILLADDHPAICFALKVLLEKHGDMVVSTSTGEKLLSQLHQQRPDLLILDLELKHADGLDLLPRIKQHFPELKILIFTSQSAGLYALRTLQAGAQGFINKNMPLENVEPLCRLIMTGYQCFPEGTLFKAASINEKSDAPESLSSRFSDREMAVLNYLKQGKSNKEIADLLMLSNKTISTYKTRMLQKCGCDDLNQLISLIFRESDNENT
ncbi:response regulator transcription factor [Enterobacter cloacae]|uniref:response regulator transcription factor n=1 Tax=Enterobacter TaxID=547 RepID=UPI000D1D4126|nr:MULTISPECIES: response regulator transcription factor [Enterobacter]MBJ6387129.1 response regulator transcription factor [Enterobacter cloacae]MBJ6403833.1 response regulator transcription factor [Enterobacter cloacae]MBJ6435136.1 response regulator transcription factor [Enterobacter cloacae]MBJ6459171.1 response regulator transcription factor [Enterobacter cloacae]MBJ6487791.1 response regulator transcription factor [Enterobacter cloacae]